MKGYDTSNGYMGYVEGKYILFASEQEYYCCWSCCFSWIYSSCNSSASSCKCSVVI